MWLCVRANACDLYVGKGAEFCVALLIISPGLATMLFVDITGMLPTVIYVDSRLSVATYVTIVHVFDNDNDDDVFSVRWLPLLPLSMVLAT